MTQLARSRTAIARPLKVLVPLIQEELSAAERAGVEHYRRAGDMLLEAREQVAAFKWSAWLRQNFTLSRKTASNYMALAIRMAGTTGPQPASIRQGIGIKPGDYEKREGYHQPIGAFTLGVDTESLSQARQSRDDEINLHRELALELVEIGFKALATRLHPDRGGSKDAMRRLNRVREELKGLAQTRRFD